MENEKIPHGELPGNTSESEINLSELLSALPTIEFQPTSIQNSGMCARALPYRSIRASSGHQSCAPTTMSRSKKDEFTYKREKSKKSKREKSEDDRSIDEILEFLEARIRRFEKEMKSITLSHNKILHQYNKMVPTQSSTEINESLSAVADLLIGKRRHSRQSRKMRLPYQRNSQNM